MIDKEIDFLFKKIGLPEKSSVSSQLFCQGVAALLGVEASMLDSFQLDFSLKKIFPIQLAKRFQAVPLRQENNNLTVALVDPFDAESFAFLRFALDKSLEQIVAPPERVKELLKAYCDEETISLTPVADHVEKLLEHAIRTQASDLHLDPSEHGWKVRYRIDGVFQEQPSFSKQLGSAIVSRIKLMAHLNISEQRRAQDGRLEYRLQNEFKSLSRVFRIATLPTQFGESLVLRLLDHLTTALDFESLSFPVALAEKVVQLLEEPHGFFIVTGPTGSGKTTTLYSCLQHLHHDGIKIMAVEDPVEYPLEGALQIEINEAIGFSFARALRSLLRHDPDIIMVGEIRDAITARMALQASLTGHRVLSTLHTNDAIGTIPRLLELGVETSSLATTLRGVLAQRLLRTICSACCISYEPGKEELLSLSLLKTKQIFSFYRGTGCDACRQTGYAGRQPIFEFFLVTDEIQSLLHQGVSHLLIKEKAIEQGMVTLRTEALRLLCEGITTTEEVLKWT